MRAPWPTPEQELLLRVAFGEPEEALAAWRRWRERNEPDTAEPGSLRLMPLLYRRLAAIGADDPALESLKHVYRGTWYRNQLLFRQAAALLEGLRAAGLQAMVIKGAALAIAYYRDPGVRPMEDVDVLVRTERAADAIDALRSLGWRHPELARPERLIPVRHAEPFLNDDGGHVDLHWNALWQPGPDDAFWETALPAELHGVSTRIPCPALQVVVDCAHGVAWNPVPPVRWVADAATALRAGDVDWELLVAEARRRRVTIALAGALDYLRRTLAAPVPKETIAALRASPTSWSERAAYRAALGPPTPLRTLSVVWHRHRRLSEPGSPLTRPPSFLAYLRLAWRFERAWELPAHAMKRTFSYGLARLRRRTA